MSVSALAAATSNSCSATDPPCTAYRPPIVRSQTCVMQCIEFRPGGWLTHGWCPPPPGWRACGPLCVESSVREFRPRGRRYCGPGDGAGCSPGCAGVRRLCGGPLLCVELRIEFRPSGVSLRSGLRRSLRVPLLLRVPLTVGPDPAPGQGCAGCAGRGPGRQRGQMFGAVSRLGLGLAAGAGAGASRSGSSLRLASAARSRGMLAAV